MTEKRFDVSDLEGLDYYIEKNKDKIDVVAHTRFSQEIGDAIESILKFGKRNNLESKGVLINNIEKNESSFEKYYELKGRFIDRFYAYNI